MHVNCVFMCQSHLHCIGMNFFIHTLMTRDTHTCNKHASINCKRVTLLPDTGPAKSSEMG